MLILLQSTQESSWIVEIKTKQFKLPTNKKQISNADMIDRTIEFDNNIMLVSY